MPGSSTVVRVPWQGLDIVTAPPVVQQGKGTAVNNFLPGRPGKLVLRGPIIAGCTSTAHVTAPGFWISPFNPLVLPTMLFLRTDLQLQTTVMQSPLLSAPIAAPALLARLLHNHTTLGGLTYGIGADASLVPLKLWSWDGVFQVLPISNGPTGNNMRDVTTHLSRVFVLGGTKPGGGGGTVRSLFWTDPAWDGTDTVAKWSDDVSGLVNEIVLDEPGHTLQSFNGALYVLGQTGIQALRGSSPSSWAVRKISNVGCIASTFTAAIPPGTDTNTSVVTDEGIYYVTDGGVVLFDGAQTIDIGAEIRTVFSPLGNGIGHGAELCVLDSEWLGLISPLGDHWFLYHRGQRQWTEVSSSLFTSGRPRWLRTNLGKTVAMDDTRILETTVFGKADLASTVLTANSITNGRDARTGANADIIASATSKMVELGSPKAKATLHRLVADFILQSSAVSSQPAWTVSVLDEAGTVLGTQSGISTTTAQRQRIVIDVFTEVDSVQVKWDLDANSQLIDKAEIHDAVLEFIPGRDRTG